MLKSEAVLFKEVLASLAAKDAEVAQLKEALATLTSQKVVAQPKVDLAATKGEECTKEALSIAAQKVVAQPSGELATKDVDAAVCTEPRPGHTRDTPGEGCTEEASSVAAKGAVAQPKVELAAEKGEKAEKDEKAEKGKKGEKVAPAAATGEESSKEASTIAVLESDAQPCDELAFQSEWTFGLSNKARRHLRKKEKRRGDFERVSFLQTEPVCVKPAT